MCLFQIMCFTAFSFVSLVISIISIQLLRMGLVNHTTDGHTFQKEEKDILILVALGSAGIEILFGLISSVVGCCMANAAKHELFKKHVGAFHVQVMGEKDVVLVTKNQKGKYKVMADV